MRRGDIARRRFVSCAIGYADSALRTPGETLTTAAEYGVWKTLCEAEHGGIGVGRATARKMCRDPQVVEDVARRLAEITIGSDLDSAARRYDVRDEVRGDRASTQPRSARVEDSGVPEERTGLHETAAAVVTLASSNRALPAGEGPAAVRFFREVA